MEPTIENSKVLSGLFTPLSLGDLTLENRLAVSPMTRISASHDGVPTPRMTDYYSDFGQGGFGLVLTEGIYTDKAYSQGYFYQPGLTDRAQMNAWREVVSRVHEGGAKIFAQLMHAGALSQGNRYKTATKGPSAIQPKGLQMQFYRGAGDYPVPEAMTLSDIHRAIDGFAEAAVMAQRAGFDGVEVHGANGYLLDQFFTEGVNLREDEYGGDVVGRLKLTTDVATAVRAAVGASFIVGMRISQGKVNDFFHKWSGQEEEAATAFQTLGKLPLDYIHTTEFEAWKPAFEQGNSLAQLAKEHARLPIIANGSLHDPQQASAMLQTGSADIVALGRGALAHSDWPNRLAEGRPLEDFDRGLLSPLADLLNADNYRSARLLKV